MKGRRMFFVIIMVLVTCWGLIYFLLLKYFLYSKYNIHAQRAALNRLNGLYHQEFELLSTEFETTEIIAEGASYVHIWTFVFRDIQGRQFNTYVRLYGLAEKGDGNFNAPDYSSYVDDTYGQLCIEERLGDKFDLYQYRQEKGGRLDDPQWEDYMFVCTNDTADQIAKLLTEIYFMEMEFSRGGCLKCLVNNETGEKLFSYHWGTITRELQKQNKEILEKTVQAYILDELLVR